MSEFPIVSFSQILRRVGRFEPRNELAEYQFAGTYSFARGIFRGEKKLGSTFSLPKVQRIRSEDFVYCKIMAWEGAFGVVPLECDDCVMSGAFVVYEIDRSRVDPRYLNYYFKVPVHWENIGRQSTGTNVRRRSLHPNQFEATGLPLPPLVEQRRIVAKIDELAAKIEEASTLRQQTAEETDAFMDSGVRAVFTGFNEPKQRALGDLTTKIGSGSTPPGGRASYPASGVPFIRSLNVRMRRFEWKGITFIDRNTHERMKGTQVSPNDVLLNITGASIGRVACVPADLIEGNVNQHVSIIRPFPELDSKYLMYWLSQPSIQEFINNEQKGATRQGFTKSQIEKFQVPILSLSEQQRIVTELDALQAKVDNVKRIEVETSEELEALLPSILDKAFKGEL